METSQLFFNELTETDTQWIFSKSKEKEFVTKEIMFNKDVKQHDIIFIIQGLIGSYTGENIKQHPRLIGPGEILNEMLLLEDDPTITYVEAIERTTTLMLDRQVLLEKINEDLGFGTRFYRATAKVATSRLQEVCLQKHELEKDIEQASLTNNIDDFQPLFNITEILKTKLLEVNQKTSKNGQVPNEIKREVYTIFQKFTLLFDEYLGGNCKETEKIRESIGHKIQQEILPYMLLSENGERVYKKPCGYAGDYLSIELMYQNKARGIGALGRVLDRCFLDLVGVNAVRNRCGLLQNEISKVVANSNGEVVYITSMACGPARELFELYKNIDNPKVIKSTLIDLDEDALQFVKEKSEYLSIQKHITMFNENLISLAVGRSSINIVPQDLVYSIGLIDYFSDKYVILLLNYIHKILKPGGKVILGNFHTSNPNKALMDYVFKWKLIHRSEEDMHQLFLQSVFKKECDKIQFEAERINLFAECSK